MICSELERLLKYSFSPYYFQPILYFYFIFVILFVLFYLFFVILFPDENLEDAAVFLLSSGCEANSCRRPIAGTEADLMTPLHMCASWGLEKTATALTNHGAKLNAKVKTKLVLYTKKNLNQIFEFFRESCDKNNAKSSDKRLVSVFGLQNFMKYILSLLYWKTLNSPARDIKS